MTIRWILLFCLVCLSSGNEIANGDSFTSTSLTNSPSLSNFTATESLTNSTTVPELQRELFDEINGKETEQNHTKSIEGTVEMIDERINLNDENTTTGNETALSSDEDKVERVTSIINETSSIEFRGLFPAMNSLLGGLIPEKNSLLGSFPQSGITTSGDIEKKDERSENSTDIDKIGGKKEEARTKKKEGDEIDDTIMKDKGNSTATTPKPEQTFTEARPPALVIPAEAKESTMSKSSTDRPSGLTTNETKRDNEPVFRMMLDDKNERTNDVVSEMKSVIQKLKDFSENRRRLTIKKIDRLVRMSLVEDDSDEEDYEDDEDQHFGGCCCGCCRQHDHRRRRRMRRPSQTHKSEKEDFNRYTATNMRRTIPQNQDLALAFPSRRRTNEKATTIEPTTTEPTTTTTKPTTTTTTTKTTTLRTRRRGATRKRSQLKGRPVGNQRAMPVKSVKKCNKRKNKRKEISSTKEEDQDENGLYYRMNFENLDEDTAPIDDILDDDDFGGAVTELVSR